MEENLCPECGTKLVFKVEEVYCPKCGLVVDTNPIDSGVDWDQYDDDDSRRAGLPSSYLNGDKNATNPTEIGIACECL